MEEIISYDQFNHYMEVLKENEEIEEELDKALRRLSSDFGGFFFGKIVDEYLSMLNYIMHDKYNDIEYFIYELNWGKEWEEGMVTTKEGKDIKMATVKDLYNYLKEKYDED